MAKQYLGTKLQDLGDVLNLDVTDKIVIVKPKDEGVMRLEEFIFYIQQNLDLSNYYTSFEADKLFTRKTDVYTIAQSDAKFAFIDRVYTRAQSDAKYALKEESYDRQALDDRYAKRAETYTKSELYNKDETFRAFALKTELPAPVDLTPYSTTTQGDKRWAMKHEVYSKVESDGRFAPLYRSYSKTEADGRFANKLVTYTKEETDAKFLDTTEAYDKTFIQNNFYMKPELYTKLDSDARFALKSNVYTVAAVNEQFAAKSWVYSRGEAETTFAPILTTYTKVEIDAKIGTTTGGIATDLAQNYYTKTDSNAKFATIATTYTKTQSDGKYALISNTMTTTQLSTTYFNKTQINAMFAAIDYTPFLLKTDAAKTYATLLGTLSKTHIESTYYTRAEVDDAIRAAEQGVAADSAQRYITAGFADGRYATLANTYTRNQLYTKDDLAGTYEAIDTRDVDEPPSIYVTNYKRRHIREFKRAATIGVPGKTGSGYVGLQTQIFYGDYSGGNPVQMVHTTNNRLLLRAGTDKGETWSNWVEMETIEGAASKYYTKTEVDNNTYNKTQADDLFATKTALTTGLNGVYTKAQGDARYARINVSYLKAQADARFVPLNLDQLTIDVNVATGGGSINFKNTHATNHHVGELTWYNKNYRLGGVGISNTASNQARFVVDLRPNFTTANVDALIVTSEDITHSKYGRLDTFFAKSSESYTRAIIDDLLNDIRNSYLKVVDANLKFNTVVKHDALAAEVNSLKVTVKADSDFSATTYAKKTDVYTKSESDAKYFIDGSYTVKTSHATTYSRATFNTDSDSYVYLGGLLFYRKNSLKSYILNTETSTTFLYTGVGDTSTVSYVTLSTSGISHRAYGGYLHNYFAKASDTYLKREVDANLKAVSDSVYTKAEADSRFGSLEVTTATATGHAALKTEFDTTKSNLDTNYYPKSQTYSKTELNRDFHPKFTDIVLMSTTSLTAGAWAQFNTPATAKKLGGLHWRGGAQVLKVEAEVVGTAPTFKFSTGEASTLKTLLSIDANGMSHLVYGNLHDYFAKSADTYTKIETNAQINLLEQKVYLKPIIDSKLTALDAKYTPINEAYTKAASDAKYALKSNSYTTSQLYTKTEADGRFAASAQTYTKAEVYSKDETENRYVNVRDVGGDVKVLGPLTSAEGRIEVQRNVVLQPGWNTIGYGGTRTSARFLVAETTSGNHVTLDFSLMCNFTRAPSIVVNNYSSYGTIDNTISQIKVTMAGLNNGLILRIFAGKVLNLKYLSVQENIGSQAFTLIAPVPTGTDTESITVEKEALVGLPAAYELYVNDHILDVLDRAGMVANQSIHTNSSFVAGVTDSKSILNNSNLHWITNNRREFELSWSNLADNTVIEFKGLFNGTTNRSLLKIEPTGISHYQYGKLDTYFAKASDTYTKAEVYTKVQSDSRYLSATGTTVMSSSLGYSRDLSLVFKKKTDTSYRGGIAWQTKEGEFNGFFHMISPDADGRNADLVMEVSAPDSPVTNMTTGVIFRANHTRLWHRVYGNLHDYFAKSAETYTKAQTDQIFAKVADFKNQATIATLTHRDNLPVTTVVPGGAGYWTIAASGRQAAADFTISSGTAGGLSVVRFSVMGTYGKAPSIVIHNTGEHASLGAIMPEIQVAYGTSYTGYLIRLKIDHATFTNFKVRMSNNEAAWADGFTLIPGGHLFVDTPAGIIAEKKALSDAGAVTIHDQLSKVEILETSVDRSISTNKIIHSAQEVTVGDKTTALRLYTDRINWIDNGTTPAYIRGVTAGTNSSFAFFNTTGSNTVSSFIIDTNRLWHRTYGNLHEYFAKSAETYTKTDVYTKAESDARYLADTPVVTISGSGNTSDQGMLKLLNKDETSTFPGSIQFYRNAKRFGAFYPVIRSADNGSYLRFTIADSVTGSDLNVVHMEQDGIWHRAYGNLHTYFAKAADVYTKAQSDARYAYQSNVYTKTEGDSRYLLNSGLATLTGSAKTGVVHGLVISNTELTSNSPGSVLFNYAATNFAQIAPVYINATTASEMRFYIGDGAAKTPALITYFTKDRIWNLGYGFLDEYFAKASDTYSKSQVYTKAESDVRYAYDSTTYKKTELYTKAESDARYVKDSSRVVIEGDRDTWDNASIVLKNTSAAPTAKFYGSLQFYKNNTRGALIYPLDIDKGVGLAFVTIGTSTGTWVQNLLVTQDAIQHVTYGNLHDYFARSALTYTKTETDTKLAAISDNTYTKAEVYTKVQSDANYYSKALADTRFALNSDVYSRTEGDGRYLRLAAINNAPEAIAEHTSRYMKVLTSPSKTSVAKGWNTIAFGYGMSHARFRLYIHGGSYQTLDFTVSRTYSGPPSITIHENSGSGTQHNISAIQIAYGNGYNGVLIRIHARIATTITYGALSDNLAYQAVEWATPVVPVGTDAASNAVEEAAIGTIKLANIIHETTLDVGAKFGFAANRPMLAKAGIHTGDNAGYSALTPSGLIWGTTTIESSLLAETTGGNSTFTLKGKQAGTDTNLLVLSSTGLWHKAWGNLDTYFAKAGDTYTKVQTDQIFAKASDTYTKAESDARYVIDGTGLIKMSQGGSSYPQIYMDSTGTNSSMGGLIFRRNGTHKAYLIGSETGLLWYSTIGEATSPSITFSIRDDRIWHRVYGDLHEYFALSAETYTKAQSDARFALKTASYTKAESDSTFALKSEVAISGSSYTKSESDAKYFIDGSYTVKTSHATTYSRATFNTDSESTNYLGALLFYRKNSLKSYILNTETSTTFLYTGTEDTNAITYVILSTSGIHHKAYGGYLHNYFAKASDTYTKAEVYTKVQSDGRYVAQDSGLIKMSQGGSNYPQIYMDSTGTSSSMGGLIFRRNSVHKAYLIGSETGLHWHSTIGEATSPTTTFSIRDDRIWHRTYGNLHEYFAKTTEVYAKADVYSRTQSDTRYYTKAEADNKYHTKTQQVADIKTLNTSIALKADKTWVSSTHYTKAEGDKRYPLISNTYTKADVYTKAEINKHLYATDNRTVVSPPSFYQDNHTREFTREFKSLAPLKLPGTVGSYGILNTNSPYPGFSGGGPVQTVHTINNRMFIRSGLNATTWSDWAEIETVEAAAVKYVSKSILDSGYYTKTESNALYYTQAQARSLFVPLTSYNSTLTTLATKAYSDSAVNAVKTSLNNYYTKAQSDSNYYTKTYCNTTFATKAYTDKAVSDKVTTGTLTKSIGDLTATVAREYATAINLERNYYNRSYIDASFVTKALLSAETSKLATLVYTNGQLTALRSTLSTNYYDIKGIATYVTQQLVAESKTTDANLRLYTYSKNEANSRFYSSTNGQKVSTDLNQANAQIALLKADVAVLKARSEAYKVGDIYVTTKNFLNSAQVNAHHGYGTWERFAQGRTVVGLSTLTADPVSYKTLEGIFGANTHTLTPAELPTDGFKLRVAGYHSTREHGGGGTNYASSNTNGGFASVTSSVSGWLGQAHNIVQPSVVAAYWKRIK